MGGDFLKSSPSGILLFLMSSGNSRAIMISDTKGIESREGRWIYILYYRAKWKYNRKKN